jgi:integrase
VGTLSKYAKAYIVERSKRGELQKGTAQRIGYSLASLDKSFGNRPINQFGTRAVERWLESHKWRASTRVTYIAQARMFCRWLLKQKVIAVDPFLELRSPRRPRPAPRPVPRGEAALLWDVLPDARARLIYQLLYGMGMRCCGVSSLRIEDIDFVGKTLFITEKGGHSRRLPLMPAVEIAIADYMARNPAAGNSGPLIRSTTKPWAPVGAGHIGKMVATWMRAAGVKRSAMDGRNAHALRHSALTEVAEATGDAFIVQELAGWSSAAMAASYVRAASTDRLRGALTLRTT